VRSSATHEEELKHPKADERIPTAGNDDMKAAGYEAANRRRLIRNHTYWEHLYNQGGSQYPRSEGHNHRERNMRSGLLFLVTILLTTTAPGWAWGPEGHRIVCAIAYDELSPIARERVTAILGIKSKEEFADTCNWADEIRPQRPETASWHFVNVPPGATTVDLMRDCSGAGSCVVAQIDKEAVALKDRPADPAETLKFLAHFVGDVHQPLHISYEADRGGNSIKGAFFKRKTNLHAIWDSGLIVHDGRDWESIAQDLETSVTPQERRQWMESKPIGWANESLSIALAPATRYAKQGDRFKLGAAYEKKNLPVALKRLQQAGVRLAGLLNSAFGPNPAR
jgi:hypothetical protein